MKFPGSHKIVGTVYSDMDCDESLRKIYANIAESKKSKKILACRLHTDFFGGIVHAFLTHTWGAQAIERMNP